MQETTPLLTIMFHGFAMALADSVPGVSGGTIAFILGFYERFLTALHDFFGRNAQKRRSAFVYLTKFGICWCVGMGASVLALARVFETNIYVLSSLFIGLTVAAIPFILKEERDSIRGHGACLPFGVLGAVIVAGMTALRTGFAGFGTVDFAALLPWQYAYLLIAGVLAISAMLLPGISGSTFLLILGIYVPAISAIKEVMILHLNYLPGLIALALGVLTGIIFAAGWIRWSLQRYRPQMVWLILGLLVGSPYAIVMGPATLELPQPPLSIATFHIPAFAAGVALLCGLEWLKVAMEKQAASDNSARCNAA